jgi:hypothetical protein
MIKQILILCLFSIVTYSQVKFDANFESGNINTVSTTDSVTFNVTTKQDIGGRWFYFRISGVKNRFVRVKVTNSDVKRAMYSYDNKTFKRFTLSESPSTNVFQKTYENDTVFVAYYSPYVLSKIDEKLELWAQNPNCVINTLGYTNHNLPMRELVITDNSVPVSEKYIVWIHARTHPGETPSSYHFEGLVNRLLEDDEYASFIRKKVEFHLIPTTNPDGVYYGRSRTNFDGVDLESNWNKPEDQTTKEVRLLKNKMTEVCNLKVINVALNLHSIASPSCTFYVHTASSTSDYFYRRQYQLAYLNTSNNDYFYQTDINESNLSPVYPEGWLWANYGETPVALTYETPYDYYSMGTEVTDDNLRELGYKTLYAIADFLELSHPKYQILDNKNAVKTGEWSEYSWGTKFYSDNFYSAPQGFGFNTVTYTSEQLPTGEYSLFAWWQDDPDNASNTRFIIQNNFEENIIEKSQKTDGGNWNYLTNFKITTPHSITIKVDDFANGNVVADAFKIVYIGEISSVKTINEPDFTLYQNYPNPFNPSTTIKFSLQNSTKVTLRIYNVLGKLITTLVDDRLNSGTHEFVFDASSYGNLSSGVYYYQLITEKSTYTKGMILVK